MCLLPGVEATTLPARLPLAATLMRAPMSTAVPLANRSTTGASLWESIRSRALSMLTGAASGTDDAGHRQGKTRLRTTPCRSRG